MSVPRLIQTIRDLWLPDVEPLSQHGILPDTGADLTTAIQAVIDAYPGKTIRFDRRGTYLVNTVTTNSLKWCLSVTIDNTFFAGVDGAELKTTQDAAIVFFAGPARNGAGFTNYATQRWAPRLPVYALTGSYAKGITWVTLGTPADVTAMGLAPGTFVLIRTGQTVAAATDQPDGEIIEVDTANPTTGVVTFKRPTAAPYAQEYYLSGTTGKTSTSVTANPAPFGLAAIDPYLLRNVGIRNLKITAESLTTQNPFVMMHCDRLVLENLDVSTSRNGFDVWGLVDYRYENLRVTHTAAGTWWTHAAGATCQSHGVARNIKGKAPLGVCYTHCHEGAKDVLIDHVEQECGATGAANGPLSVRSRGYDIRVVNSRFVSQGTVTACFVDEMVEGGVLFDNNYVDNASGGAVRLAGPNQTYGPNNRRARGDLLIQQASGIAVVGPVAPLVVRTIQNWASDDNLNPTLGVLPIYAMVSAVHVHITQAFDGTTPALTVGWDAGVSALVASFPLTATGFSSTMFPLFPAVVMDWDANSVDDWMYVAEQPCKVIAVRSVVRVAGSDGGSVNLMLRKCTGTQAPSAGNALMTGTINLKGTADTSTLSGMTATAADVVLATADRVGRDFTGVLTAAVGMAELVLAHTNRLPLGTSLGYRGAQQTVEAYVTGTGITTGRVLVTVEYVPCPAEVT